MKQDLINYLLENGKNDTWVNLYNKFPFKGDVDNKKKSDYVRLLYKRIKKHRVPANAKVLVFDLELSPMLAYIWKVWKENIQTNRLLSNQFMISWAAKWLFEDDVISDVLTKQEILEQNDTRITKSLWKLIDEADIIIAHNAIGFDVKHMNTAFLKAGLPLPSPYQVIDTLLHARKKFALPHNSLNALCSVLDVPLKLNTNFELWSDCMKGKKKALKKMDLYCRQDVRSLEEVYIKLRPYIQPHPNLGLFTEGHSCPTCASHDIKRSGTYKTYANIYPAYTCKNCGSISRGRKSLVPKQRKKKLLISTPK